MTGRTNIVVQQYLERKSRADKKDNTPVLKLTGEEGMNTLAEIDRYVVKELMNNIHNILFGTGDINLLGEQLNEYCIDNQKSLFSSIMKARSNPSGEIPSFRKKKWKTFFVPPTEEETNGIRFMFGDTLNKMYGYTFFDNEDVKPVNAELIPATNVDGLKIVAETIRELFQKMYDETKKVEDKRVI